MKATSAYSIPAMIDSPSFAGNLKKGIVYFTEADFNKWKNEQKNIQFYQDFVKFCVANKIEITAVVKTSAEKGVSLDRIKAANVTIPPEILKTFPKADKLTDLVSIWQYSEKVVEFLEKQFPKEKAPTIVHYVKQ